MPEPTTTTPIGRTHLLQQHRNAAAGPADRACRVLDYLVDAVGGEPSCPLRRIQTLIDIACNPGTSQTAIMNRLGIEKSALSRSIDWLYNYGCIIRNPNPEDARESALTICGFSRTHLGYAAHEFGNDFSRLQKFVDGYINFFDVYRGTLRDAKIVTILSARGPVPRQIIMNGLYNGPATTDSRAVMMLIEQGFIEDGE